MAQTIKIKRSAVAGKIPTTTDIALGELALNTNDGKLFMLKNNGVDAPSVIDVSSGADLTLYVQKSGATMTGLLTGNGGFAGNLTGNVTGDVSGSLSGNASTASALQTARTINGVAFDGTASITVPAVDASKVAKAGDTMSGNLLIQPASGTASIAMSRASLATGQATFSLSGGTSSSNWQVYLPVNSSNLSFFSSAFNANVLSLNTDGSANFASTVSSSGFIGPLTGTVTGHATLDLPLAGGTMSGMITSTASEAFRIAQNGGFYSGYNTANTTRQGYIQFNNTGTIVSAEVGTLTLSTNQLSRVIIDATGNVGIGKTAAANVRLDINGYVVAGQTDTGFDVIDILSTNGVDLRNGANGGSNNAFTGTQSNHPYYLQTNGVERLRINAAAAEVGIGKAASSGVSLDIQSGTVAGIRITGDDTTGYGVRLLNTAGNSGFSINVANGASAGGSISADAGPIAFIAGGAERARMDGSGLGINTTNITSALTVLGGANISLPAVIGGAGVGFSFLQAAPNPTQYYKIASLPGSSQGTNDNINIYASVNDNWDSFANREMHIIMGNRNQFGARYLSLLGGAPTGAARIVCYAEADTSVSVYAVTFTGFYATMCVDIQSSIDVTIFPGAIGSPITAPTGTLVFDSFTTPPVMSIDNSGALNPGANLFSGAATYWALGHGSSALNGASFHAFYWNNTLIGNIAQNGTTGTSYNTTSDARRKENIADAPSASSTIDAIQVRSFDWKTDGSHVNYGFVAQELEPIVPNAVTVGGDDPDMQPWSVDYSKLVPMLVKEIQELRARVAALEAK